ncbi:MAG TPA: sugar isomerase [Aliidongia sp.]|uniref:sugar isomerase n=1 Tax=Aliidongia sp. TaxID=1914230 RepID=UPI002DDD0E96|nr:sugar isomerase [Aliidongia sp.]HEV2677216.1 sugar isomerase [Aliidongia sp.]
MSTFSAKFIQQTLDLVSRLDQAAMEAIVDGLVAVKARGGRLFIIGSGGGAGHASHAVNDFRKIVGIEAYSPTDNVSELTARINDDGWETAYANTLKASRFKAEDAILVFSVGGGDLEKSVSVNLVRCLQMAKELGAAIFGIVGRDGGYTRQVADACVVVPIIDADLVTPHTEGLQAVVWHLLVSHPKLKSAQTKWESVSAPVP